MSNSVELLLLDVGIIGSITAFIVSVAILLGRRENHLPTLVTKRCGGLA